MDFHIENWDDAPPPIDFILDMETIAMLYELQAMTDGSKLPSRTSNAKTAQSSSSK